MAEIWKRMCQKEEEDEDEEMKKERKFEACHGGGDGGGGTRRAAAMKDLKTIHHNNVPGHGSDGDDGHSSQGKRTLCVFGPPPPHLPPAAMSPQCGCQLAGAVPAPTASKQQSAVR